MIVIDGAAQQANKQLKIDKVQNAMDKKLLERRKAIDNELVAINPELS